MPMHKWSLKQSGNLNIVWVSEDTKKSLLILFKVTMMRELFFKSSLEMQPEVFPKNALIPEMFFINIP